MSMTANELKDLLLEEIERITLNEPEDSVRLRLGLMDPPAGAYNQYFTTIFFADAEIRGVGMSMNTIDHCLRDPLFNMEQIRVIVGFMLPFSGEFLDYAGLRTVWKYLQEFIRLVNEVDDKKELQGVCRALTIYINYMHAWTHLMAPWGSGGAAFNFRSKEEDDAVSKFYLGEDALKKAYPFDRGQNYDRGQKV